MRKRQKKGGKEVGTRKMSLKHDVQPRTRWFLDETQTTQEDRNGGSGSRWWWGKEVQRRKR
jgi:hypothetical protein